jgi:two-component system, NtrC family, response regulator AtoC
MDSTILIVDDEANVRLFLRELLEKDHWTVLEAENAKAALACVKQELPAVVVLDLVLPDCNGLEIIQEIRGFDALTEVVVITAIGTVDNAVQAMKLGACDFITKPFDIDKIEYAVHRAMDCASLRREHVELRQSIGERVSLEQLVGDSNDVNKMLSRLIDVRDVSVPLLITGETGTGKTLLARQFHRTIAGESAPLIYIDCSTIPKSLFESELFGHEKGAYTGATSQKRGRVEEADSGTLIMDEITEVPLELQPKLLNFISEMSFYRVGGTAECKINVRIIAISNRDLDHEVNEGRFRKDLYFRLNMIHCRLRPLRERTGELRKLTEYFIEIFRLKYVKPVRRVSESGWKMLYQHDWPGNVRELKNVVERAVIMSDSDLIEPDHMELMGATHQQLDESLRTMTDEFEKKLIVQCLNRNDGSRAETAKELGTSVRNLQYKLSKFDIN